MAVQTQRALAKNNVALSRKPVKHGLTAGHILLAMHKGSLTNGIEPFRLVSTLDQIILNKRMRKHFGFSNATGKMKFNG